MPLIESLPSHSGARGCVKGEKAVQIQKYVA
jgi:hypothetical protein